MRIFSKTEMDRRKVEMMVMIKDFGELDSCWTVSIYPNMGTLSLMFLRKPLVETSSSKFESRDF